MCIICTYILSGLTAHCYHLSCVRLDGACASSVCDRRSGAWYAICVFCPALRRIAYWCTGFTAHCLHLARVHHPVAQRTVAMRRVSSSIHHVAMPSIYRVCSYTRMPVLSVRVHVLRCTTCTGTTLYHVYTYHAVQYARHVVQTRGTWYVL